MPRFEWTITGESYRPNSSPQWHPEEESGAIARGFGYLALDPSPRLRRLRQEAERAQAPPPRWAYHLPPLPDSCYPPGAVPLDCSGIPAEELSDRETAPGAASQQGD